MSVVPTPVCHTLSGETVFPVDIVTISRWPAACPPRVFFCGWTSYYDGRMRKGKRCGVWGHVCPGHVPGYLCRLLPWQSGVRHRCGSGRWRASAIDEKWKLPIPSSSTTRNYPALLSGVLFIDSKKLRNTSVCLSGPGYVGQLRARAFAEHSTGDRVPAEREAETSGGHRCTGGSGPGCGGEEWNDLQDLW